MRYPWEMDSRSFGTFIACTLCAFLSTFATVMTASALKSMISAYNVSITEGMWLSEATVLSTVVFSVITIDISDKIGKKMTVILGMQIIVIASILSAFVNSIPLIVLARTVCGAGCALIFSANLSILADVTKKEYMTEVMSFNHSATSLGGACGPIIGQIVASLFGLEVLFLSIVPVCVIAALLLIRTENVVVDRYRKINYSMHILLIASLFCILTGLIAPGSQSDIMLLAGIVLLAIFIIVHKRAEKKIFNIAVFKNKVFATAVVLGLLFSGAMYAADNTISYYLQIIDYDMIIPGILIISTVSLAALIKGMKPVIQIVLSPVIARMIRGKNPNYMSIIGFGLLLFVFVLMIPPYFIRTDAILFISLLISGVLLALGNSIFKPTNKSIMMSSVTKEERNSASAVTNIVDNLSKIAGVVVLANLLVIFGNTASETMNKCLGIIMAIVLAMSVIGMWLSIRRISMGYTKKAAE